MGMISMPATSERKEPQESPRIRLEFLDGLRGLAAFYVAFHHIGGLDQWKWLPTPVYAVSVFIVLSGYCLMLPVAHDPEGRLQGGIRGYLKRRARRILPPYYAVLGFCILFALVYIAHPFYNDPVRLQYWRSNLSVGNILSHLFIVHNLRSEWVVKLNPPLWSVATEWQIYFFFPFMLLPVWRKRGLLAAVTLGFAVGLLPCLSERTQEFAYNSRSWYLGLFSLGMSGAVIGFHRPSVAHRLRDSIPWGAIALVPVAALFLGNWLFPRLRYSPAMDVLVGLAAVSLIIYCARALQTDRVIPVILRLLESRPIVALGRFSYSLYLVHLPASWVFSPLRYRLALNATSTLLFQTCVVMPLVLLIAYRFHLVFEKPFMRAR